MIRPGPRNLGPASVHLIDSLDQGAYVAVVENLWKAVLALVLVLAALALLRMLGFGH
jgi:hypothetical protein